MIYQLRNLRWMQISSDETVDSTARDGDLCSAVVPADVFRLFDEQYALDGCGFEQSDVDLQLGEDCFLYQN